MGLRGPLRDPHSIRGQQEMPNFAHDEPEKPSAPAWLSKSGKELFDSLVSDLIAARVPIKRVDSHAIAMAAGCIDEVQRWSELGEKSTGDMRIQCAQVVARNQRDAQQWFMVIGATPKSRAQMGLRGAEQKKVSGPLAVLQRRKQTA